MVFKTKNTMDGVGKGREEQLGDVGGENAFTKKRINK
jgi:hypothetical protein